MRSLPRAPGTYLLVLRSTVTTEVEIGRKGRLVVVPGWYVYVGSAFGPGGLRARVGRHLRQPSAPRWHIDYLRRVTAAVEVWYAVGHPRREADWASRLADLPRASLPLPGFGASDHRGATHLVHLPVRPGRALLTTTLCGGHCTQCPPLRVLLQKS